MSGICGICGAGAGFDGLGVERMAAALRLPADGARSVLNTRGAQFAAVPRWDFQQVWRAPDLAVAADADLVNLAEIRRLLGNPEIDAPACALLADLYRRYGATLVDKLEGAFAFAIWDESAGRLLLATDRFGIKPVFWRQESERLLFATRVSAVAAVQSPPPEPSKASMAAYLLLSAVPAPLTVYQGIERLRPGHVLIYEHGHVRTEQYWDLTYVEEPGHSVRYWAEQVRDGIRSAVQRHAEGLDPNHTGAYLSGGTDSSSVVAFLSEVHKPAKAFSIIFAEGPYDESRFARTTAARFAAEHFQKNLTAPEATAIVTKLIEYYDEPFANSSAVGAFACAQLAAENRVGMLLAGDGGDELFAGNERYATDKQFAIYHLVPAGIRHLLIEPLASVLPDSIAPVRRGRSYIRRANTPNPRRMMSFNFFLSTPPEQVFTPDFLAEAPPEHWLDQVQDHFDSAVAASELNRTLHLDIKVTLADNDLRKVMGTAEMAGVRVRFPFLDTRLAELSGRIPAALKLRGFEKRYVFKQAMKGILPHEVLYKKKHGFGVPLARWILEDAQLKSLTADLLCDRRTRQRGYFQPAFFDRLLDLHRQEQAAYYGEILWYLVVLELWHRQCLEPMKEASLAR